MNDTGQNCVEIGVEQDMQNCEMCGGGYGGEGTERGVVGTELGEYRDSQGMVLQVASECWHALARQLEAEEGEKEEWQRHMAALWDEMQEGAERRVQLELWGTWLKTS